MKFTPALIFCALLWLPGLSRSADVRDFGARGDGVADDTGSVERAVGTGGVVRFPAGTYRLTRTVVVDLTKTGPVSLVGDGAAVVRMNGAGPAFHFVGTQTDCLVTGIHINGGAAAAAIAIYGGRRFHVANCTVVDVTGLALLLENVSGSFVHGNMVDLGDPARTAIRVSGGYGNIVRDNHVIGRIETP